MSAKQPVSKVYKDFKRAGSGKQECTKAAFHTKVQWIQYRKFIQEKMLILVKHMRAFNQHKLKRHSFSFPAFSTEKVVRVVLLIGKPAFFVVICHCFWSFQSGFLLPQSDFWFPQSLPVKL